MRIDSIEDEAERSFKAACERYFQVNDVEAGSMLVEFEELASGQKANATQKLTKSCGIFSKEDAVDRRTHYLRIKDQVRTEFHTIQAKQRKTLLEKLLIETPDNELDNDDPTKRRNLERAAKSLHHFARKYNKALGARPFLIGIYTLIQRQVSPTRHVLRWHIDTAALTEAAGDEFISDAIQLIRDIPLLRVQYNLPDSLDLELHPSWSDENLHRLLSFAPSLGFLSNSSPQKNDCRPTGNLSTTSQLRNNINADLDDPLPLSNLLCSPNMCHLS
mmetsp:Transcript_4021/g.5647  ORF Transcript_4021/g.5647 Transcript_4021/m.5647 type:complete len:275 (-) Transcript_4021:38-862(-)